MKNFIKRDVFDFDIGYLTKSPCRTCKNRNNIPKCYETCRVLDKIRTILARGISSQASSYEP